MLVIANNITTRNAQVDQQLRRWKEGAEAGACSPAEVLEEMARQCVKAGADILEINIQQHHDRPAAMEFAVKAVQQVTDRQLCLSSNNPEALEAGLRICKRPPLVDYVSVEEARLRQVLPLVARHGADVVLLITDPAALTDAQGMLKKAAVLVGAANESGIANRSILIDPGLLHVTSEAGQRHLVEVAEFLRALPEIFDPPVGSTCWLSNSSAQAPWRLRPRIETALLAYLAGLGLSSVFLDVLKRENMRMVRLLKVFKNETIYADDDIERAP